MKESETFSEREVVVKPVKIAERVSLEEAFRKAIRAQMDGRSGVYFTGHVPDGFLNKVLHYMPRISFGPMTFDVFSDGDV